MDLVLQEFNADESIVVVKLNRPEALNALNHQLLDELDQVFTALHSHPKLRCVILTGSGEKAFAAGADIKEMQSISPSQALHMAEYGQRVMQKIEDFKVPVIAAVHGFALGGGLELAMACDFIVASTKAKVGLPEVSLGLIPGYGGTQRLSRYVGKAIARMMTLTGEMISAQQALDWGLFAEVTAPEELMTKAMAKAEVITLRGPLALFMAKQAINGGYDGPQGMGMQLEAQQFSKTFETRDHEEGIKAFMEKRKPDFQGE